MRRFIILASLLLLPSSGCFTPPLDYPHELSEAISPAEHSTLKDIVDVWREQNPGPSGFYPLISGRDAFGARLRLIQVAEKSIDAQYFLMKGDTAGQVFSGSLLDAANRGVRIRLLLDDIFTSITDEELEILNSHPNVELRLYNPISRRGIGLLNFIFDFKRANRRMHNKSFTVDNQVTIVGGRNIADEYFELRPEADFVDLDVLAIGPVAGQVSMVFDEFWNDGRSIPLEAISSKFSEQELTQARKHVDEKWNAFMDSVRGEAMRIGSIRDLFEERQTLYSADAEVITDNPNKLRTKISDEKMILAKRLAEVVMAADMEVIVLTPYFVPGKKGLQFWKFVVDKGVRVVILTNSLSSTNHIAVHSAYSGLRKRILDAGVELYEARADAIGRDTAADAESLTLHAKAMIIDRARVFIGSLNLDPRSIEINSEMGLLIHSEIMADDLAEAAMEAIANIAYRVERDDRGQLRWRAMIDGVEVVETSEPLASRWRRFLAFLLKIVPNRQL